MPISVPRRRSAIKMLGYSRPPSRSEKHPRLSAPATDRDKIKQIFRFLQELHYVKSPPDVDLALYEWKLSYDAVARYASVERGDAGSGFIRSEERRVGKGWRSRWWRGP